MKRTWSSIAVMTLLLFSLAGCGAEPKKGQDISTNPANESIGKDGIYEIAFITGEGELDDGTFYQSTWEGIAEYAQENRITYSDYRPVKDDEKAREEAIESAIKKGARVVIAQGDSFETVIYRLQNEYPKVQFLLLDGEPHDENGKYETAPNAHCLLFKEEEAGYLAGYAAVCEGYDRLGFLGGKEIPQVKRYGYGFIQGADQAAKQLGREVTLKYDYADSFLPSDEIRQKMEGWYDEGTQIVFACGGAISESVIEAAEIKNGKVIGVDKDQSKDSKVILTSAVKNRKDAVEDALEEMYDNGGVWTNEQAGKSLTLGVREDGVELPDEKRAWRFENFSERDYEKIHDAMEREDIIVLEGTASLPMTTNVRVEWQNTVENRENP